MHGNVISVVWVLILELRLLLETVVDVILSNDYTSDVTL